MINLEDDIFQAHCQIDYLRDHIENGGLRQQVDLAKAALSFIRDVETVKSEIGGNRSAESRGGR